MRNLGCLFETAMMGLNLVWLAVSATVYVPPVLALNRGQLQTPALSLFDDQRFQQQNEGKGFALN